MPISINEYLAGIRRRSLGASRSSPLTLLSDKRSLQITSSAVDELCAQNESLTLPNEGNLSLKRLFDTARSALRERGERSLHIALGRFEMQWPADPSKSTNAPIYLLKVQLVMVGLGFRLEAIDDVNDWELNPVIRQLLEQTRIRIPEGNLPVKIAINKPDTVRERIRWLGSQCVDGNKVDERPVLANISSADIRIARLLTEDAVALSLANNAVVNAKLNQKPISADDHKTGDAGIEDLGIVLPCDDSQLRVIQLSGKTLSLQVEGPPGTGKSQTIANIISNLILGGKKVLFVCDKAVAVQQVRERLDKAGLGSGILFLHDEDTKRLDFVAQANITPSQAAQPDEAVINNLKAVRDFLNKLWEKSRAVLHPAGADVSIREGLGGLIRLRRELGSQLVMLEIPGHSTLSFERIQSLKQVVEEWTLMAEEIADSSNPWNQVRGTFYEETPAADNMLQSVFVKAETAKARLPALRESLLRLGVAQAPSNFDALSKLRRIAELVRQQPIGAQSIMACNAVSEATLAGLYTLWIERENLLAAGHPITFPAIDTAQFQTEINLLRQAIPGLGTKATWAELAEWHHNAIERVAKLDLSCEKLSRIATKTGCSPTINLDKATSTCIRYANLRMHGLGVPAIWWEASHNPVDVIARFKLRLKELSTSWERSPWRHSLLHPRINPLDLRKLISVTDEEFQPITDCVEKADEVIGRLLRPSRKGKNLLRTIYGTAIPLKMSGKDWDDLCHHTLELRRAALHLHAVNLEAPFLQPLVDQLLTQPGANSLKEILGNELLSSAAKLAQTVRELRSVPEMTNQSEICCAYWSAPTEDTDKLIDETKSLLDNYLTQLTSEYGTNDLSEVRRKITSQIASHASFIAAVRADERRPQIAILATLQAIERDKLIFGKLEQRNNYSDLCHVSTHWHLNSSVQWEKALNEARWRDELRRLIDEGSTEITPQLWQETEQTLIQTDTEFRQAQDELFKLFDLRAQISGETFESASVTFSKVKAGLARKQQWLRKHHWKNCLSTVPELGPIWQKLSSASIVPASAWRNFQFNFILQCQASDGAKGPDLEGKTREFRKLDESLTGISLSRVKRRLRQLHDEAGRIHPVGRAAISFHAGLQKIQKSVREILQLEQVTHYLTKAKPCWMMSPASLSAYLGIEGLTNDMSGETTFDCVIFDEASQMRVMEAVYCMSYARQTVIVGDRKQLPPTNFFRGAGAEDDEEESVESVLEEFGDAFSKDGDSATMVSLLSHYRSETPDLIAFNNEHFYGNKLEICPPRYVSGHGLEAHLVADGRFEQRKNQAEALKIVELVAQHVTSRPDKSLGVVVMNYDQMEHVESLLERANADVRYFTNDEQRFFLRNLETVQGDEADYIILGLTYGKNEAGRFSANSLGPILRSGGERRLNVATSRSKMGMQVVTSLTATDLNASSAESAGFKCFQNFLRYLDTISTARDFGITSKPFEPNDTPSHQLLACDSDFEVEVGEFLGSRGIEVLPQYGAGRYRIDFVVRNGGQNILAIECDGAAYHSTLTARTRDRARQRQLESRGWRFHRIWSRNWYHDKEEECRKLLESIQRARLNPQPEPAA
jgi:very-short-patch-repair endonuclease